MRRIRFPVPAPAVRAAVFSALLCSAAAVCVLCDLACSGGFTWSPIPVLAIAFGWLVLLPVVRSGPRGISGALIALICSLIPFLYGLDWATGGGSLLLPIGLRTAAVSTACLWAIFLLFQSLPDRRLLALSAALLLLILLSVSIRLILSVQLSIPVFDLWDTVSCCALLTASAGLFAAHRLRSAPARTNCKNS